MKKQNKRISLEYLSKILSIQSSSSDESRMRSFLINELYRIKDVRVEKDEFGNIYATKGYTNVYPCIVSHIDTVHDIHDNYTIFRDDDILFAFNGIEQVGTGGDDCVGIFVCLTMLKRLSNVKAAFFSQEEIGCIGSGKCDLNFFDDCSLVLQCDRRGNSDFIHSDGFVDLYGEDFEKKVDPILKLYGYKSTIGALTDVIKLKERGLDIAVANMSCGYYSPHTDAEIVSIEDVTLVTNMVQHILIKLGNEKQVHKHVTYKYSGRYSHYNYRKYDYFDDFWEEKEDSMSEVKGVVVKFSPEGYFEGYCEDPIYVKKRLEEAENEISLGLVDDVGDMVTDLDCPQCRYIIRMDPHGNGFCPFCVSYYEDIIQNNETIQIHKKFELER